MTKLLSCPRPDSLAERLDRLYGEYNTRDYVVPDPLQFLYEYADLADREIAGLVAATLAFGNVKQIVRSVARVLALLPQPRQALASISRPCLEEMLAGFRHRFVTGRDVAALLWGARQVLEMHGSLETCFRAGWRDDDVGIVVALERFVQELRVAGDTGDTYLLPLPSRGSACKRLHLYLRWMVRRDAVDPGGWDGVDARELLYPVDTHMHQIGRELGFTRRRSADVRAALEITTGFRRYAPEDPVRYDFALTRTGIRPDAREWRPWVCAGNAERSGGK